MPKEKLSLVLEHLQHYRFGQNHSQTRLRYTGTKKPLVVLEKLLRKNCPVSLPVVIKYCNLTEAALCARCLVFADKTGKLKRFEIEVDTTLPEPVVIDSFIHEWAHAMDYDRNGLSRKRHRKSWGVCFAEAWTCYDEAED
jgi:hypothetical protein